MFRNALEAKRRKSWKLWMRLVRNLSKSKPPEKTSLSLSWLDASTALVYLDALTFWEGAKGADARREAARSFADSSRGAPNITPVLRDYLKNTQGGYSTQGGLP